jgi:hypothetical protein
MYNIYVLKCPISGDIRYVGQTKMKLIKRLSGHLYDAFGRNKKKLNHKDNWIRKLLKDGYRPLIESIETFSNDVELNFVLDREKFWILNLKNKFKLLNSTDGGEYSINNIVVVTDMSGEKNPMFGKNHTELSKKIMSEKKLGLYDGINNPRAKTLYQYDENLKLIKKWKYAKECCDFYKISKGNVSSSAKINSEKSNNFIVRYGFIFSFIEF